MHLFTIASSHNLLETLIWESGPRLHYCITENHAVNIWIQQILNMFIGFQSCNWKGNYELIQFATLF